MNVMVISPIHAHADVIKHYVLGRGHKCVMTLWHDDALEVCPKFKPSLVIVSVQSLYVGAGSVCPPDLALNILAMPIPRPMLACILFRRTRTQDVVLHEFGYDKTEECPVAPAIIDTWLIDAERVKCQN